MNTAPIKSFARISRLNLCEAVSNQLKYWGFDEKGNIHEQPVSVAGGYSFRGNVYNDVTVVPKWENLRRKVSASKESFKDVVEEAAYTWFNRLTAIKILEENQFIAPVLRFREGSTVPEILQQAKAGNHTVTNTAQLKNLQEALLNNQDEKAFAILIIDYCSKNQLLKEIFGKINDYTEILIPQNLLSPNGFLGLLNDEKNISEADFREVELIGWLYQFYIADKKDEVFAGFKKNKKARPEDIPAATQIFTPKWIVSYMVENTVGKMYLDFEEQSVLKTEMKYLVENEDDKNPALINDITELTLIDPASGSGHILVTGFAWLFKMYREQGYAAKAAVEHILHHNLFGLDLDDRAMQLARFAVLLKAAQQLEQITAGQGTEFLAQKAIPIPHVYAFPETHHFTSEEIALFTENKSVNEIFTALNLLQQGKNIGSALKLTLSDEAREVLETNRKIWDADAEKGILDIEKTGIWENLKTYVEVALVLTKKYAAVVANPPYMGRKSMNGELAGYLDKNYPNSKSDLFAVFIEKMMELVKDDARMGCITMESWMFLSSYEKLRKSLIDKYSIVSLGHFGWHILGIAFGTAMVVLEKSKNIKIGEYSYLKIEDVDREINVPYVFPKKDNGRYARIPQTNFDKIPGSPIAYWVSEKILSLFSSNLLGDQGEIITGLTTGNNNVFLKVWSEISKNSIALNLQDISEYTADRKWIPYTKGGGFRKWFGNHEFLVDWSRKNEFNRSKTTLQYLYFKQGFTWSFITAGKFNARYLPSGFIWDVAGSPAIFNSDILNKYALALVNSSFAQDILEIYNPTMNYQSIDVQNIPFKSSDKISNAANLTTENIFLSKTDWDSRETSWDFAINPLVAQNTDSLPAAFSAWRQKVSADFFQLHQNEEELNRIFIEIYGLQDELTPEVALKDITILQDELKADDLNALEDSFRNSEKEVLLPFQQDVVVSQLMSWLIGVLLGRYRLDKTGLHIAHPNPTEEETAAYPVENVAIPFTLEIDDDAIIPLMGSNCAFPDDAVRRIEDLVYHIWGAKSQQENMNFINRSLGMPLEKWITEKFWDHHISGKMYKKKPIYWLFCSNPKKPQQSAFRVLVYMHRMDEYTVQKVMRQYLHPQQEYLRSKYEEMHAREALLTTAEKREFENLQKQQHELKEYNEALKKLADLQISFDLDDGVSVNYAKFAGIVAVI
ncbi:BREX-1 system adenine-specific DNA-methyltransferase PglX [Candidatus Kaistella beijingensis]|uniref:BREX-1 system adenine-specific DNA-methyltransferase PglX n=1 Tax=Candidatus Kaistella beijingensis TaxID=2820270 RepID=UPI001CC733EF|nr:BREX-1 system adenine-specific DNA-methyltransferase PglX [Candidatus Kaistella beijingensis]UBB90909.1 BREX-1 system adenine-specific DNA-methyltransferase PglX [Candidatus Kaistella beijingensis]